MQVTMRHLGKAVLQSSTAGGLAPNPLCDCMQPTLMLDYWIGGSLSSTQV
jgi:hypothetical protein